MDTGFMTVRDFIFSDKVKHRVTRHLVLWALFCLYFFIVSFLPANAKGFTDLKTYTVAFHKMIYIPISLLSAYVTAYVLLPRYLLKEKYFGFIILFIGLCLINLICAFWLTKFFVLLTQKLPFDQLPTQIRIFQPVIYGLGLGTAAGVFACIARLLKIHYLKQKENERLEKQMIITELEIIKTHFRPHFLSDALQNISYLIRNRAIQSADAILKLADLLSYFLYENEKERVPLEKEIEMVRNYLDLEKTFYGDRIIINFKEQGDISSAEIAPLIFVSLVQHCCEQSLLSLQQKLVIDIEIKTENRRLVLLLSCNGYYETISGLPQQNLGLNQVLKRAQVLYPDRHRVQTHLLNGVFSLVLFLESGMTQGMNDRPEMELAYDNA